MSIKVINFNSKDVNRSTNPIKPRKLPLNRPKMNIDDILNNISPKMEEKKEEKKVLFSEVVEVAQYDKQPEKPILKKEVNRSPSPKRKQKEITEYFKKEIETLDSKLGKRTRSPSPIRCSSPVKNYYNRTFLPNEKTNKTEIKKYNIRKVMLDLNWYKERDRIIYDTNQFNKLLVKKKLSKMPMDDLFILKFILGI